MARSIRWRGRASLPGVPTKDMSAVEAKQYGGTRYLVETGVYEYIVNEPDEDETREDVNGGEQDDGDEREDAEESGVEPE